MKVAVRTKKGAGGERTEFNKGPATPKGAFLSALCGKKDFDVVVRPARFFIQGEEMRCRGRQPPRDVRIKVAWAVSRKFFHSGECSEGRKHPSSSFTGESLLP